MPQKIFCSGCGVVLYKGFELELESPVEIIARYNSKCPNCKKKLVYDEGKVKVKWFEEDPTEYRKASPDITKIILDKENAQRGIYGKGSEQKSPFFERIGDRIRISWSKKDQR